MINLGSLTFCNEHNNLANVRLVKKNLVYVIGLTSGIQESVLKSQDYFGQYGTIKKIIINYLKNNTACAYITYSRDEEAEFCIKMVDDSIYDGKVIRCTYGTTKYCTYFLKNLFDANEEVLCPVADCMYLHEIKPLQDILTKEELSKNKLHKFKSLNKNKQILGIKKNKFPLIEELIQLKVPTQFKAPIKIQFEPIDFFTDYYNKSPHI